MKSAAPRLDRVISLERALQLLVDLSAHEEGLRVEQLMKLAELPRTTVYRLLRTLKGQNFVSFEPATGIWRVGRQAFIVGAVHIHEDSLASAAAPYLKRVRDLSRETANLGLVQGGDVVILSQVASREINRASTSVGGRVPVVNSGLGKAILSTYGAEAANATADIRGFSRFTPHSITRMGELREQLGLVAANGFAVDDEEFRPGLRCVAAPVFNSQSEACCAISVSGLATRISSERIRALGTIVEQAAHDLTLNLGGITPQRQ